MTKWNLFQTCKTGSTFETLDVIYCISRLKKKNLIIYEFIQKKHLTKTNIHDLKTQKTNRALPQLDKKHLLKISR